MQCIIIRDIEIRLQYSTMHIITGTIWIWTCIWRVFLQTKDDRDTDIAGHRNLCETHACLYGQWSLLSACMQCKLRMDILTPPYIMKATLATSTQSKRKDGYQFWLSALHVVRSIRSSVTTRWQIIIFLRQRPAVWSKDPWMWIDQQATESCGNTLNTMCLN